MALPYDINVDGVHYKIDSSDTVTIVGQDPSDARDLIIPPSIEHGERTYKVTSVSREGLASWSDSDSGYYESFISNLTSVYLPDTVTRLEEWAFGGCHILKSVRMPPYLAELGSCAFGRCEELESIIIPDGVEVLWHDTFIGDVNLKSVSLPNTLKRIDHLAFELCESLERIEIPYSVEEIDFCAFYMCSKLKKVMLHNPNMQLGRDALPSGARVECIIPTNCKRMFILDD